MRTLRTLFIGIAGSTVWPAYVGLAACAARVGPWPRSVAVPAATALAAAAAAALLANLVGWLLRPGGSAQTVLDMPPGVTRQVRRAARVLIAAHVVVLMPGWLLHHGLITAGGRPVAAPAVVRGLVLVFELITLGVAVGLLRRRSPLVVWLTDPPSRLGPLSVYSRAARVAVLAGVAGVITLDARGYSFSAHRLSTGAAGTLAAAAVCWGLYRVLLRAIDRHAWQWIKFGHALRRRGETDSLGLPDDLAGRLRRLSGYLVAGVGLLLAAWVWDVDLALFRFISEQPVWSLSDGKDAAAVTVGDLTRAVLIVAACAMAWRHMSTFFAVAVFPRMPDDPGVRFAVVTLCRYAVLGLGLLAGLSAVHLGLEKIGVVLAALGVGLGFGLQEVVSNFVCGIILLLERPIRVGDIVSVGGMTGKVDRINIRATTIINGDNQSIIIPNRAFITGDLVNWTLKDKVIRVSIGVKVAPGTDPDRVAELLLAIARDDVDVLRNPLPGALMEGFTDAALSFTLHAHVPDPSLAGRVKHRLFREIQRRFEEAGILIPLPTQTLLVKPADPSSGWAYATSSEVTRVDAPSPTPPVPRMPAPRHTPAPVEDCHRGVDE